MQSRLFYAKSGHVPIRVPVGFVKDGSNRRFFSNYEIKSRHSSKSLKLHCAGQLAMVSAKARLHAYVHLRPLTALRDAVKSGAADEDDTMEASILSTSSGCSTDVAVLAPSMSEGGPLIKVKRSSYASRRLEKSTRIAPSVLLARYLVSMTNSGRANNSKRRRISAILQRSSFVDLPTILLRYLIEIPNSVSHKEALAVALSHSAAEELQSSGFTPNDVHSWAVIVTAPTDEQAARRYLRSQCQKPSFLLLEILRRDRLSPELFRLLLVEAWRLLLGNQLWNGTQDFSSLLHDHVDSDHSNIVGPLALTLPCETVNNGRLIEETTCTVLISRLLRHARQVWPAAIVSISHMIALYCKRVADGHQKEADLEPGMHSRLSKIVNMFLYRLSLPASQSPMNSMTYNWRAQRVLLELAGSFRPSLHLNRDSYRAVASVLAASPKSPSEVKFASLVQRSWPPWRRELDGMDVERSPEDDISRAVAAVSRMKEAGYPEEPIDRAIQILGGREPDGTPTIQTRTLIRKRKSKLSAISGTRSSSKDVTVEWAARIRTTRDIYEAWAAFSGYTSSGHPPSLSMYEAMFEKLIFDYIAKSKGYQHISVPGDGMEVMPVVDDNLSESEKRRIQPPSLDDLYSQMIREGIRPSGRCLSLLLSRATSLQAAFRYLQDGGALPLFTATDLLGSSVAMDTASLKRIPDPIFVALIRFLCQSKHNCKPPSSSNSQRDLEEGSYIRINLSRSKALLHAFELMKRRRSSSRSSWYALFAALSRQGLLVDSRKDQNQNDILSWRLFKAALDDSRSAGLWLDPAGFQMICICLQKALLALPHVSNEEAAFVHSAQSIVKVVFSTLSESVASGFGLPRLLHEWGGSHLHAYVRTLGLSNDAEELLNLLRWMVKNQAELKAKAEATNDIKLLRRTLIAIRAFFDNSEDISDDVMDRIKEYVDQLVEWGGWPTSEEVDEYQMKRD